MSTRPAESAERTEALRPTSDPVRADRPKERSKAHPKARPKARPLDLANYLRERADDLANSWSAEITAREVGGAEYDGMVRRFMAQLTVLLPWLLGPHSAHIQPLWDRTSELFGVIGAKRGLAAGEVIEEFQILRGLLIRTLYEDPPAEGPLALRDMLRLNRIVDRGVTHAGVGHTDALFFQFFEAQEEPLGNSPGDIAREAEAQLKLVEEELAQIVEITPAETAAGSFEN